MTERWATFDCYGTLVDWNGGIGGVLRRLWPGVDVERLLRRYHALEPLVQEGRGVAYREVGARTLRALAALDGLALRAADEYAFADSLPDWPVFAEVPSALTTLEQHRWRVAILSNTDPDLLAASIERIGVRVDLTITAAEARSYKPAHGHWRRFFERSGADRQRHVHVGASAFHDLVPAAQLGLQAVWINRLGEHSDSPRAAELPDLRDLPETLERLVPAA
ncbi:MAG: HAD hydrolase-like protein [Chloroflexi bacterium]|nr:HAD hydrolase-like protein [Chloroflexota bacterium]